MLVYGVIIVLVTSLFSLTGFAQSSQTTDRKTTTTSEADRAEALSLLRRGQDFFIQKQYQKAITSWRSAYSLFQDPKLLYYIASAYEQLGDHCEEEEKAWSSYFVECARGDCYHHQHALGQRERFSKRCYIEVKFVSNAAQTEILILGNSYELPYQRKMLKRDYEKLKVSAPSHLSEWIDLDLTQFAKDERSYEVKLMLTPLPNPQFLDRHKWIFTLSTAISGVAFMSFGSLKLSDAMTARDLMASELTNYDKVTPEFAEKIRYEQRLASFKDDRLLGFTSLTLGAISMGVSAWLFLRENPHQEVLDRARRQGDIMSYLPDQNLILGVTPILGGAQTTLGFNF